jgi:hypothetical protein
LLYSAADSNAIPPAPPRPAANSAKDEAGIVCVFIPFMPVNL